jgi:PHD/YefM family antitoxin component YafN of YafNO toxin-antitoxin module
MRAFLFVVFWSLTTFRRRSGDFMKQLKKSKRPVVLVKDKAAAVVQDAEAYQHLLDIAASADAEEGIRQSLENAKEGKLRPARKFFHEFEAAHGISR